MEENLDLSKNIEINQALKEFEQKSIVEQTQKAVVAEKVSDIPKIVELVMKWFKIEQKQAEYALLGFVIVIMGISLYLFFGTSIQKELQKPSIRIQKQMK